ncbi:hypothetical protein QS257_07100 [Terrilactibacillus sp. S3-3]|nr:hypothetical protein QS257_07100 [Terrilactibacillus sp. S3-3]
MVYRHEPQSQAPTFYGPYNAPLTGSPYGENEWNGSAGLDPRIGTSANLFYPSQQNSECADYSADSPFPYTIANAFPPQYSDDYTAASPDMRPVPQTSHPAGYGDVERRLRRLENRQDQLSREINRIENRIRIIEYRLGIPAAPIGHQPHP